ncbi:MAG: BrnT family toxin [Pyrinomonadaceae bacterium]
MFDWNEPKRKKVIGEHGIDFAEIADVFDDPFALYFEDYEHSIEDEIRFNIIGRAAYYGLIFVVFIYDDENGVYYITARRAENWMVKEYEKNRK